MAISLKGLRFHEKNLITIQEFRECALSLMDTNTRGYYEAGAEDEITLRENLEAFNRIIFRPRFMVDVSKIDTSTTILGKKVKLPFGFAPSAFHRLCHEDGEKATAIAAKNAGICMCLSTYSTYSMEDVADAADNEGMRMFQLYFPQDRSITVDLLKRAKAKNYQGIALTADAQVLGLRIADEHNKFKLPSHMELANFSKNAQKEKHDENETENTGSSLHNIVTSALDQSLNWKDIAWIKEVSGLPVAVKGIMTAEDAILAQSHGADAVWVSNHGGRQADGCLASIDALPEIVEALKGSNVEIYLDGGVRRGSDIFKALALGANYVFVARPVLYGLTVGGAKGVSGIVAVLQSEFERMMKFAGTTSVDQISKNHVQFRKW
uniref:Hydroxyacid oxidase n=2 Tax=Nephromyces sp. MMRI TaxID=2496275 RepID=A0A3Q8UC19_9APIC|nr:hydroxyacid oxidase [Nephromyces sp. MMRI]AZL94555.1 hydroxyacid oxidase [Nephromyces sp. MMRI]